MVLPASLIPLGYDHGVNTFFTNISGFYREAKMHPIDLLDPPTDSQYFRHVELPSLNTSSWNETRARELRGEWDWAGSTKWDMNLKERGLDGEWSDWTWVKGAATLTADVKTIDYDFYGLHYTPNGTYNLFAQPDGTRIDIRNIPRLYPEHPNITSRIVLAELEKEYKSQQDALLLSDVKPDGALLAPGNALMVDPAETACPLLIYLSLPPLPPGISREAIALYEDELRHPTGIRLSLTEPPRYWEGLGLGGVAIADECGWAFGIDGGTGVKIDEFWRKFVNCK